MRSLLMGWRVSAQRTRADWPLVAAAWLITLLAAGLVAAGVLYPSAASEAGLRRALADAPPADVNVQADRYGTASDAADVDARVQAELQRVIEPSGGSVVRDWRITQLFALSGRSSATGEWAILGTLDGLPDHATLVSGTWPANSAGPSDPMQVVVLDTVATALDLSVGDAIPLVAYPTGAPLELRARLVGTFAVPSVDDPYWNADPQLLTGLDEGGSSRTFGPFLTTPTDLIARAGAASLHVRWRAYPAVERLRVADLPGLRARVEAIAGDLEAATGRTFVVSPGLASILRAAERSLLVSATGVILVLGQLAILAAYVIVLTASLLVDHRRLDTALLRSRGAGVRHIALLSLAEALAIAIPAVLLAPWLAVGALDVLNVAGPFADVRLRISPLVTSDVYLAAAAGGLACVVLIVVPAALGARRFAAEQGGLSRQETRTFGQRLGLDVALLAVTGIAIWQLRLYGAPITRTVQGNLGFDPLLVAAPAIGLVAGAVLALRILPLLAHAAETAVSRGRGLIASLGSRQLARRPLRYTRSALLLMLAMSTGVFALSYGATWSNSQRDQAAYQTGADVRVVPGRSTDPLPAPALPAAYASLPGVEATTPVERIPDGVGFAVSGSADLIAVDAATAGGIVLLRPDQAAEPLDQLMGALRGGRPSPRLAALPEGAAEIRLVPWIDVSSAVEMVRDPATGLERYVPVDPASVTGVRVRAIAIVRDARGLAYRVASDLVTWSGPTTAMTLSLDARLAEPLQLAGLALELWLPEQPVVSEGRFGVSAVSTSPGPGGPWIDVPLASAGGWLAKMAQGAGLPADVSGAPTADPIARLSGPGPQGIPGFGTRGPAATLSFVPADLLPAGAVVPAVANAAFMAAFGLQPGDTITATVEGRARQLAIAGVVDSFPTTDPARPLIVLDEPTLALLRLEATGGARNADEWWLSTTDGDGGAVAAALRGSPFGSAELMTVGDRTRSLSTDPVALGIIGILALGFAATGLFAGVVLTVSAAVSARQRRTELALLRALGLSGRQLSGSLWLENGSLVLVSLLAGTGLGLLVGWLVLPFLTVTQGAASPMPPVVVHVPWDRVLALEAAAAIALGVAVLVIGAALRRLGVGSVLRMGED